MRSGRTYRGSVWPSSKRERLRRSYASPVPLNRSRHLPYAETYAAAREISQKLGFVRA